MCHTSRHGRYSMNMSRADNSRYCTAPLRNMFRSYCMFQLRPIHLRHISDIDMPRSTACHRSYSPQVLFRHMLLCPIHCSCLCIWPCRKNILCHQYQHSPLFRRHILRAILLRCSRKCHLLQNLHPVLTRRPLRPRRLLRFHYRY